MSCQAMSPSNMTITYLTACKTELWQLSSVQNWSHQSFSIFTPTFLILIGDITTELFWWLKSYLDSNLSPLFHFNWCFSCALIFSDPNRTLISHYDLVPWIISLYKSILVKVVYLKNKYNNNFAIFKPFNVSSSYQMKVQIP